MLSLKTFHATDPLPHRRGLQSTNLGRFKPAASDSSPLSFPYPSSSSSSDLEGKSTSLDGEIGGFTSLLPVFTMSFTGQRLFFQPETGPRLYFILLFLTTLLAKEFTKGQFLAYVGRLHPIFPLKFLFVRIGSYTLGC